MKHQEYMQLPSFVRTIAYCCAVNHHESNPSAEHLSDEDVHDLLEEFGADNGEPEGFWLCIGEEGYWLPIIEHALTLID